MNKTQKSDNHYYKNSVLDIFKEDDYFEGFAKYFINICKTRLVKEMDRIQSESLDKMCLIESILINYKKKIYHLAEKTLIHEFHQTFDEFDEKNESKNYDLFSERLKNSAFVEEILNNYPVLEDLISRSTSDFIRFTISIIKHWVNDYKNIQKKFNFSLGKMRKIEMNAGDVHNGGKSVVIIEFENDKLVYKPRSLKIDVFYEKVIDYVNQHYQTNLKTPLSLDQGEYGWQEYVQAEPCDNIEQVRNYYYQFGMHLGFIYAFQGSDFHFENIIACRDKPVLVDLETLFQSSLVFSEENKENVNLMASAQVNKTILKSAFFNYMSFPEDNGLTNIGGLINTENQKGEKEEVLHIKTDKISMRKKHYFFKRGSNLPVYKNKVAECFEFEKEFIEGFERIYIILKKDLYIPNLISNFSNAPIRIIVRPTYVYAAFLETLLHPMYLKDYGERRRVLSFIKDAYTKYEAFDSISPFEIKDMMIGDIPYFNTFISEKQVYSNSVQVVGTGIMKRSAKQEVLTRLANMSEEDMYQQVRLINMALSSTAANLDIICTNQSDDFVPRQFKNEIQIKELIQIETDCILKQAMESENDLQWVSIVSAPNGTLSAGPLSFGLYDGLAGVGLYFSAYNLIYNDEKIKPVLRKIVNSINQIYEHSIYKTNFSAFYGSSSYIYFVNKMRDTGLYSENEVNRVCKAYLEKLREETSQIKHTDFIGGLAGILKVVVQLGKHYRTEIVKDTARAVCTEICKRAIQNRNEAYWKSDADENIILAGFSHGITGICYALSEYYAHIEPSEEVLRLIESALKYEDRFFDTKINKWKDNRKNGSDYSSPMWCHGSCGILLGRSRIHENVDGRIHVGYINESLNDTLQNGNSHRQGYSLCHGTMGNIDILHAIKELSLFKNRKQEIENTINIWVNNFKETLLMHGWQNGIRNDHSGLGMMLGKTGQLFALLRSVNKEIPTPLALD
ncbi:type 2 lantipeptide synthetase LanM family protein [Bacillus sp. ISL-51]|uniref:type 2 lanthipeptide synthetase LanM family protein n=1 Tax=Bacteria TaxID=2 RepID=UPI001BE53DFA|nr:MULTISPECIES: type 2 lanthipeptide synthetase LanM family protein [Bacteria]MBT2573726.1 type 2 lantipeptide synthetase LanM family protein [Bacillus sp. ISL-51]MBT2634943.1 type 2 lantipeptide synthetase LanM family protein [Bacillus sp. ISL-26]MBT2712418.1 type 2 lantipeptide synthetase LanM family protein [Pseudomonas sp. ISL-88]